MPRDYILDDHIPGDLFLSFIQRFIMTFESIFFKVESLPVDSKKICSEHEKYDCGYEREVRNPDINLIILLDDIMHECHLGNFECSSLLYDLETLILSADFYRTLIYKKNVMEYKRQYNCFCKTIDRIITLFEKNISETIYEYVTPEYSHLNPPVSKKEFLEKLKYLQKFLSSRSVIFEAINPKNFTSAFYGELESVQ